MEPEKPCPARVKITDTGRTVYEYCEQGPEGHDGTHLGDRSRGEYMRLLRLWKEHQQKENR